VILPPEAELAVLQRPEFGIRIERDADGVVMRRCPTFDGYEVRLSGHLPRRFAVVRLSAEMLRTGVASHDVGKAAELLIAELEAELALLKAASKVPRR
jgi:hypothetical protein